MFPRFRRIGFCVPVDGLPFQIACSDIKLQEPRHKEEVSFWKVKFSSNACREMALKINESDSFSLSSLFPPIHDSSPPFLPSFLYPLSCFEFHFPQFICEQTLTFIGQTGRSCSVECNA